MDLWQRTMIRLARSERVTDLMQRHGGATALARRFVVVGGPEAAVATACRLRDRRGISASLSYLGEYVSDPVLIERTVEASLAVSQLLGAAGLDVQVSVDSTAIGELASPDLCRANAGRIARSVAAQPLAGRNFLMLDMEDLSLVESTLRLQSHLLDHGLPAAVTLQARLRRTVRDLESVLTRSPAVRLVKGAFPRGPEDDHQGKAAIERSYLSLARTMLSPPAREAGLHPVFATHDDGLIGRVAGLAREMGVPQDGYEFEMLYGAHREGEQRLRAEGYAVRLYVPFGVAWWPYAVRRVGEHPRNALLLGRSLARQRRTGVLLLQPDVVRWTSSTVTRSPITRRPLLIFDGECGFCTACATWAQRRLGNADVLPGQRVNVATYGLTARDVSAAAWWIDSAGQVHRGHRAIGRALRACGGWWTVVGWACLIPPFSWVAWAVYGLVARFRHRLPGSTPACHMTSDDRSGRAQLADSGKD